MDEITGLEYGYSEMFEWETTPDSLLKFGHFVQFSNNDSSKIELYNGGDLIGVAVASSYINSNDPDYWEKRDSFNNVGDKLLQTETLSVGNKVYDHNREFAFIRTFKWEHLIPIVSNEYKENNEYVKRTARNEWVRVNLQGRAIVIDNGLCKPGDYCMPNTSDSKIKTDWGTAVPYVEGESKYKFKVMSRFSDNSVVILNKNMI